MTSQEENKELLPPKGFLRMYEYCQKHLGEIVYIDCKDQVCFYQNLYLFKVVASLMRDNSIDVRYKNIKASEIKIYLKGGERVINEGKIQGDIYDSIGANPTEIVGMRSIISAFVMSAENDTILCMFHINSDDQIYIDL